MYRMFISKDLIELRTVDGVFHGFFSWAELFQFDYISELA